jgi:putative transposase
VVKPGERKGMAVYLTESNSISTTRACRVVKLPKSKFYYRSIKDGGLVIDKFLELSQKHHREGQDKIYERIRSQGIGWNYNRVRRAYMLLGLKHVKKASAGSPAENERL